MINEEYTYSVKLGKSRRKVEPLYMVLGKPYCRGESDDWVAECSISGFHAEAREIEGRSAFDCLICGIAYLRQTLRIIQAQNQKLKLFYGFEDDLEELTIEDIFMSHDCVTDAMEEMIEWAKDNGFKSN